MLYTHASLPSQTEPVCKPNLIASGSSKCYRDKHETTAAAAAAAAKKKETEEGDNIASDMQRR